MRDENIEPNDVDDATAAAFFCFCSINKNKQLYKRSNIGKRKIKVISNCHEEEIKNKIKEENKKKTEIRNKVKRLTTQETNNNISPVLPIKFECPTVSKRMQPQAQTQGPQ